MKRIIREVVTMIRIERWLVRDDPPDLPGLVDSDADPVATDNTTVVVEESVIDPPSPRNERVVSQRVLEVRQWDVKHDGKPKRT